MPVQNDAVLMPVLPIQTLYLSAFSGPVEGILMVCVIYFITGYYGARYCDPAITRENGRLIRP